MGDLVGDWVGDLVGDFVGEPVGEFVANLVGESVGESVSQNVASTPYSPLKLLHTVSLIQPYAELVLAYTPGFLAWAQPTPHEVRPT